MTHQLDIFQSVPQRDAKKAVLAILSGSLYPVREMAILIRIWHQYTVQEFTDALKKLLESGQIIITGTWRSQMPEGWSENIYAMAEHQEAA